MIKILSFRDGAAAEVVEVVGDLEPYLKNAKDIHWVALVAPTQDELAMIQRVFSIHYLAIEAAQRLTARPEIDFYEDFMYLNFYCVAEQHSSFDLEMISFFIGENYLVTVQQRQLNMFEEVHANWERSTAEVGKPTVGLLLYSVLDPIVDSYFLVIDDIAEQIDTLESNIFQRNDPESLQGLFGIKKQTMSFRRIVAPERDALNSLLRWDSPMLDRQTVIYLQDIYDHLLRVLDSVDNYRELLGGVLDAHLSVTSNRLNQTMKTLTASSIILMGVTLIASIYGMNFVHMPELSWQNGYWFALGLMGFVAVGLALVFRRIDWI